MELFNKLSINITQIVRQKIENHLYHKPMKDWASTPMKSKWWVAGFMMSGKRL